jgi:hypothetical protein
LAPYLRAAYDEYAKETGLSIAYLVNVGAVCVLENGLDIFLDNSNDPRFREQTEEEAAAAAYAAWVSPGNLNSPS